MDIRTALIGIAIMICVGLAAAVVVHTVRVGSLERMLTETQEERDGLRKNITEMAAERAAADRRNKIAADAREAILLAPPEEDGPVSSVLRRAMDAADEIGGLK